MVAFLVKDLHYIDLDGTEIHLKASTYIYVNKSEGIGFVRYSDHEYFIQLSVEDYHCVSDFI